MAKSQIADVIVPSVFNPYVINRTMQQSALFQSGIVKTVRELSLGVGQGNRIVNMPFWNDLTGADETLSDRGALTPGKINASQDVATQLFRGRAWSANDLASTMSGDDPMGAIGNLVANYWTLRMQDALISTLKGVFSGTLNATHVNNLAIEAGDTATSANKISGGAIVDTISKLGDAHQALNGIVMHSVPYFNLVKQDLIQYVKSSDGTVNIPTYMDKRVIVDDSCPVVAGSTNGFKYTSYLFGEGAIGYAEGQPEHPTEADRDILAGDDVLVNRKHYILHPRGVKFNNATVAGAAPTNAELELTANWTKVYNDKQIRMVALITNG
jgi:hypothetical protein